MKVGTGSKGCKYEPGYLDWDAGCRYRCRCRWLVGVLVVTGFCSVEVAGVGLHGCVQGMPLGGGGEEWRRSKEREPCLLPQPL